MVKLIMLSKLESLNRCITRIESKQPDSVASLMSKLDDQDVIVLNLERAIQTCVDIAALAIADLDIKTPTTMAESFTALHRNRIISDEIAEKMRKSVGFRNVAVHQYSDINWDTVFDIITNHLDDFRRFAREITSHFPID